MKKIRILIIEDNRVLREGLVSLIDGQKDMRVVATLGSGNEILSLIQKVKPHVILLDLGLWNNERKHVLEKMKNDFPSIQLIGMGLIPSQSDVIESVEAGASGFILKDATTKEFLGTIRSVAEGTKVLPPQLLDSLFTHVIENALKKGRGKLANAVRMTKREREIIALIADGLSNKEISERLSIAIHTVKSHIHNIMEKLALHTRLQIAKFTREGDT
jgi:DNA-binding NarL/FixJ family response regulator